MAMTTAAQAQIRLPSLPGLPLQNVTQPLDRTGAGALDRVSDLRRQEINRLIRANRRVIDTDPAGEPVVRSEVLALSVKEESLAPVLARGFVVDRRYTVTAENFRVLVLRAPARWSTTQALHELREQDPHGTFDYNHLYSGGGAGLLDQLAPAPAQRIASPGDSARPQVRVGLLDSGVDDGHPAFQSSVVHAWGCGGGRMPGSHGTAVASLLMAHATGELYAADVYCGTPTGGAVDAIVAALGWMAEEHVAVINVSLVGPKNLLLETIVKALIARGHILVAAVGNDGPAAPPLYPAAYSKVVGVTAVDERRRVLIEAERGPQVMFAAIGSDIQAADLGRGYGTVRGTSFAAPAVAALLAAVLPAPDPVAAQAAIDALAKQAIDLGAPGRDLTYGFGLVGSDIR